MHKAKNIYFLLILKINEMAQGRVTSPIYLSTSLTSKDIGFFKRLTCISYYFTHICVFVKAGCRLYKQMRVANWWRWAPTRDIGQRSRAWSHLLWPRGLSCAAITTSFHQLYRPERTANVSGRSVARTQSRSPTCAKWWSRSWSRARMGLCFGYRLCGYRHESLGRGRIWDLRIGANKFFVARKFFILFSQSQNSKNPSYVDRGRLEISTS